jgi:signal transduction histidine kinase
MSELLQNLIENAVKYRGKHPPHVHLSAVRDQHRWIISVRDNGIGMGEPDRETVFEPFRRLHNVNGSGAGLGLGLATCRRIVERHGGTIWVESVHALGSTFFFTLPRVPTKD